MRFSQIALGLVTLSVGTSNAFTAHPPQSPAFVSRTSLASLAEPVGRSKDEIASELASGKVLEGGQVIDFSSVKGPSKAEQALEEARKKVVAANILNQPYASSLQDEILGINQDVIKEVGHALGMFADEVAVQKTGAYLRSLAPAGTFEPKEETYTSFTEAEKAEFSQILEKAYVESGEVTSAFAKTFYLGTQIMNEEARAAIWAVYVWCRRTDEIVDAPRESDEDMLTDLASWEVRLENLWKYGEVVDVLDLCLLDIRIKYPNLPIAPFVDMIRGMLMDVPNLGQDRYDTFEELHLYCYRVAGTVGLMSMPVFGCAPGFTEEQAKEPALSLGVAFQITNILRDIGEDAVTRGRVYLPQDDMKKFGVTEEQILAQRIDENYINLMKYEISRARMYYDRALRGVPMLAEESRLPVQSSLDCYGQILDKIEENGYDTLTKRAYVSKWEKLFTIPFSWYRTQEISKILPLPGDKPLSHEQP
mmetsp:Transcript_2509/g.3668  ORF Transcript_2509/g.3668 Transcript_2509/m.3668 type:complete len:478 (+) Transcript_2509:275-1708(+)